MSTPQTEANKDGQSTGLALATGSAVWLLFGGFYYEGDDIIACCATEAEAEALKQYGLENKTDYGRTKYGYDSLRVCCWKVGERGHGVPTLPNGPGQGRAQNGESFSMQFPTNIHIRAKSGPMKGRTFMPICCGSRERLMGFAEGIFSVAAMELADFNRVMKSIEK